MMMLMMVTLMSAFVLFLLIHKCIIHTCIYKVNSDELFRAFFIIISGRLRHEYFFIRFCIRQCSVQSAFINNTYQCNASGEQIQIIIFFFFFFVYLFYNTLNTHTFKKLIKGIKNLYVFVYTNKYKISLLNE